MTRFLTSLIKAYQIAKAALGMPPACRFYPSCSLYAIQALQRHGVLKGACLIGRRILKCTPFSDGGYDPVP